MSDRRARVLIALMTVLGMLFLVAASSVLATFMYRDGTYEDGVVVNAQVLRAVPGRPGEAEVEYLVDGERQQRWISCGGSCPEEGDVIEVEYSAGDPREVVRNRAGPYSSTAVVALLVTGSGLLVSGVLLVRDTIALRRHRRIQPDDESTAWFF